MRHRLLNADSTWWIVRADTAKLLARFSSESIIATGATTPNVDFSKATDEAAVRALLESTPLGQRFLAADRLGDLLAFLFTIAVGDVVVTPAPKTTELLLRFVKTPYAYARKDPDNLHLQRHVEPGMRLAVPADKRDQFPKVPKTSITTLSQEQVDLIKLLLGKNSTRPDPAATPTATPTPDPTPDPKAEAPQSAPEI